MAHQHEFITANGLNFHLVSAGNGPLVVLLHGFPECWYSWRYQLPALSDLGFRVIAPDLRGYGASDAPAPVDCYSMEILTQDVVSIIEVLGYDQAILIGHDWGAELAWQTALRYPKVISAVAGLSVPYRPRGDYPPIASMKQLFKDQFFYMLYFQEEGVAEREFEADIRTFLLKMLAGAGANPGSNGSVHLIKSNSNAKGLLTDVSLPDRLPQWLNATDLLIFESALFRNGLRGPLNWYRNFDKNWTDSEHLAGAKIIQPALFMIGQKDPVGLFMQQPVEQIEQNVTDLRVNEIVPGAGHWLQQESMLRVNEQLERWLKTL